MPSNAAAAFSGQSSTPATDGGAALPPSQQAIQEGKAKAAHEEWQAAKEAGKKSDATLPSLGDGSVGIAPGEDADDDTPGEGAELEAAAADGAPADGEKPAEAPAEPAAGERDLSKPPKHKDWNEFLARERDAKKTLANREARIAAREREVEEQVTRTQADADTKVKAIEAKLASVKGLDSDDPYEIWQALSAWKGWDAKEAFGTVNLRTLHGGERSVQDQLAATEKKLLSKTEQLEADLKKEREEKAAEKKAREEAESREHTARVENGAKSHIATEFKSALDAGKYRFLKKYPPEQAAAIAYSDLVRHYQATSRKDASGRIIAGTGEEVSLDDYFNGWEKKLKQDYEDLRALDPESSRASSEGPGTDHGNGDPKGSNPGTQQGNSAPPRKPTGTVTRSLTAQRSENGRVATSSDDWEEAKRLAKQRTSRA